MVYIYMFTHIWLIFYGKLIGKYTNSMDCLGYIIYIIYHISYPYLGGGNSNIFMFTPNFGEDEPNLTNIFQKG